MSADSITKRGPLLQFVHAGIVQIYEVGEDQGVHYIVQEYVAGRNLGEVAPVAAARFRRSSRLIFSGR